jgi:cruciform cutting endonuclease 1
MDKFLGKFKISTLNQVGLLCGLQSATTKQARINNIITGLEMGNRISDKFDITKLNVLAIDIGVKNFAYCLINNVDLTENQPISINNWSKLNLLEKFPYQPLIDSQSLYDKKFYINYLANEISKDLLKINPDVVVIETQRTRSNNNSITLQPVLLNYTLENLVYHQFWQQSKFIIPMTSAQMINFWLNRFITKNSINSSKNSKFLRNQLVLNWLNDKKSNLIKNSFNIDKYDKSSLLLALTLPTKNNKIDDLIDCLLYNLTVIQQLRNQRVLTHYLQQELDLNQFIDKYNKIQLDLIQPIVESNDLKLLDELSKPYS